ncbi:TIGR04149 family rSAM-modified RiPP [Flavobacterium sp. DG2-3]|nr:TIGR04149 family rSAM-modified RiPP [Flavobacterium sp. DG2-3]MDP5198659.1 TIGR04149 family rSAM-modified RiPP [Flavobacterium sp. DG2-3]
MNNSKLTFNDFQLETISKKELKTVKGGQGEPVDGNDPKKNDGGNGNT